MGILKSQEIWGHWRQREALDEEIATFARAFAEETGEPLSTDWYFDSWELFDQNIHVKFIDSYQGGEDSHYVRFSITAFDSEEQRQKDIEARKAEIAAAADKKRQQQVSTARAELDRAATRLIEAQGYSVQEQADGTHAVFLGQGFVRGGFKERSDALSFARDRADEAEEAGYTPAVA
jgi:hypothetical protein